MRFRKCKYNFSTKRFSADVHHSKLNGVLNDKLILKYKFYLSGLCANRLRERTLCLPLSRIGHLLCSCLTSVWGYCPSAAVAWPTSREWGTARSLNQIDLISDHYLYASPSDFGTVISSDNGGGADKGMGISGLVWDDNFDLSTNNEICGNCNIDEYHTYLDTWPFDQLLPALHVREGKSWKVEVGDQEMARQLYAVITRITQLIAD